LTEIYQCHVCSCEEILRAETAGQVLRWRSGGVLYNATLIVIVAGSVVVSSSPVSTVGVIILAQIINGERAPAINLAPPRPAQLTPLN
jgi:hypothetical protein